MVPPIKEAQKLLQAFVKNVAESSRSFVRWMDGTCLEMPDQRPKGDTDGVPLVMHFSSEVIRMQQVRVGPQCRPLLQHVQSQHKYELTTCTALTSLRPLWLTNGATSAVCACVLAAGHGGCGAGAPGRQQGC